MSGLGTKSCWDSRREEAARELLGVTLELGARSFRTPRKRSARGTRERSWHEHVKLLGRHDVRSEELLRTDAHVQLLGV
eukprot:4187506-Alexandrium_andersonii.AAC.1